MNLIKKAQEKCDKECVDKFSWYLQNELTDLRTYLHARDRAIIEAVTTEIQRMETRCPEYENNDYDSGAFDFRAKVLKMLDSSLE